MLLMQKLLTRVPKIKGLGGCLLQVAVPFSSQTPCKGAIQSVLPSVDSMGKQPTPHPRGTASGNPLQEQQVATPYSSPLLEPLATPYSSHLGATLDNHPAFLWPNTTPGHLVDPSPSLARTVQQRKHKSAVSQALVWGLQDRHSGWKFLMTNGN